MKDSFDFVQGSSLESRKCARLCYVRVRNRQL